MPDLEQTITLVIQLTTLAVAVGAIVRQLVPLLRPDVKVPYIGGPQWPEHPPVLSISPTTARPTV